MTDIFTNKIKLEDVLWHLNSTGLNAYSDGCPGLEIYGMRSIKELDTGFIGYFRGSNCQIFNEIEIKKGILICKDIIKSCISDTSLVLVTVDDPDLAACIVGKLFVESREAIIHPSALIDCQAKIGNNCRIGPNVVIGSDVIIGNNVNIEANAVIECCTIGDNSHIYSGVSIGSSGLGSSQNAQGKWFHFTHFGRVEIGCDVLIQNNCVIARGSLQNTIIHDGVVIGPLTWIAHNVIIEKNCFIGQSVNIAGSVVIGESTKIWGNSSIRDGLSIGNKCTIGMGAVVVKNITNGLTVLGNPARIIQ